MIISTLTKEQGTKSLPWPVGSHVGMSHLSRKSRGRGDVNLVQGVAGGVGPILVSNNKSCHLDSTRRYLIIDYRVVSFLNTTGDGVSG